MCTVEFASAPEFFLHHVTASSTRSGRTGRRKFVQQVCILSVGSRRDARYEIAVFTLGTSTQQPRAMIDLSRQPAGMRVEYETSQRENKEMSPLQGKSPGMA